MLKDKQTAIKKVTIIGLFVNIALVLIKAVIGFLGNSQALLADAAHSLSDLLTDMSILFGVKYWLAPADKDHHYGHYKIELLVTFFIAVTLLAVGLGILLKGILSFNNPGHTAPTFVAFVAALLSIISKEWLFKYTIKKGNQLKSMAVKANAWHHRSDALSSIPVAIVIIIASINPKLIFLDYIGAIIVSVFIIYPAFKMIKDAICSLIDESVDGETFNKISKIASATKNVKAIHALRTRKIGECVFVDMHILVDGDISVCEGHSISKNVKQNLLNADIDIVEVLIHIEPYEKKDQKSD